MPGIIGVVARQPDPDLHQIIFRMAQTMQRQPQHPLRVIQSPHAVIATVAIDDEARVVEQDGRILAYAGEIVDEQFLTLNHNVHLVETGLVSKLMQRYLDKGGKGLCGLNGLYTIAVWDKQQDCLILVNDRYGMQKLYTWQTSGSFLFSSEMKVFPRHPHFDPQIDPQAVVDLLSADHPLDDRTFYAHVKLLPPASLLTFRNQSVQRQTYWNFPYAPLPLSKVNEDTLIETLADHVESAVERRVRPDSCLLVTGGLDSRLVAGMYRKVAPDVHVASVSLGEPMAHDVIEGRQIADRLNFNFAHLPIPHTYLMDDAEDCVWKTEGNMNCYASWILSANPYFEEYGIRYALTGVGGEGVSGRHILLETLDGDPEHAIRNLYARENFGGAARVLRKDIGEALVQQTLDTFRQTMQNAPTNHPLNRLDYLSFHQSLRRHATSIDVFADSVHALDPLLDNDLIDFVLTLPPELHARGYLYKKVIMRHLPHLVDIGDALRGPILRPAQDLRYTQWTGMVRRINRRARRMFGMEKNQPGFINGNYIQPNLWLRNESRGVVQILEHSEYLEDLFDMDAIRRTVQDHQEGRRQDFRTICALVTIAWWRKLFTGPVPMDADTLQANSMRFLS